MFRHADVVCVSCVHPVTVLNAAFYSFILFYNVVILYFTNII